MIAEHEKRKQGIAQPWRLPVPGLDGPGVGMDVGLKVNDGDDVEEGERDHEILVDLDSVAMKRPGDKFNSNPKHSGKYVLLEERENEE